MLEIIKSFLPGILGGFFGGGLALLYIYFTTKIDEKKMYKALKEKEDAKNQGQNTSRS